MPAFDTLSHVAGSRSAEPSRADGGVEKQSCMESGNASQALGEVAKTISAQLPVSGASQEKTASVTAKAKLELQWSGNG